MVILEDDDFQTNTQNLILCFTVEATENESFLSLILVVVSYITLHGLSILLILYALIVLNYILPPFQFVCLSFLFSILVALPFFGTL